MDWGVSQDARLGLVVDKCRDTGHPRCLHLSGTRIWPEGFPTGQEVAGTQSSTQVLGHHKGAGLRAALGNSLWTGHTKTFAYSAEQGPVLWYSPVCHASWFSSVLFPLVPGLPWEEVLKSGVLLTWILKLDSPAPPGLS